MKRKEKLEEKDIVKETQNLLGESHYKPIKIVEIFKTIYIELYFQQFLCDE